MKSPLVPLFQRGKTSVPLFGKEGLKEFLGKSEKPKLT